MNILRKFALFVFSLLLIIALPLNTLAWSTTQSLMDRNVILGWLKEGKVYDNIADTAAKLAEDSLAANNDDQPQEGENQETNSQMPDANTLIKAARVALPPNVLQQNVEAIINSSYDWLEGKTDTIVLNLDLSEEKTAFIDALGNEAISRAASLPTCTVDQSGDFDPLSSDCIPSGTDVAAQAEKIKNELANSKDFLPDTNITGTDLTVGEEGSKKLISDQFNMAPSAFKNAKNSTLVSMASIFILGIIVFLLSKTRRGGLKINAWLFGLAGAWALLLGALFKVGNSTIVNQITNDTDGSLGFSAITALIAEITGTLFKWHMIIGGAYVAVAVACIIAIKIINSRGNISKAPAAAPKQETPTPVEPITEKPRTPNKTPSQTTPRPKKTTLVQ